MPKLSIPAGVTPPSNRNRVTPVAPRTESTDRKVSTRWTERLAAAGWTPVCDAFLEGYHRLNPVISNPEAMLIIHLMRHKWDSKMPFPGSKLLAKRMGISATAVRGHARSLERKGYLKRIKRTGTTNKFDLSPLFRALEAYLDTVEAEKKAKANREELDELFADL